jgi:hypothetical protein
MTTKKTNKVWNLMFRHGSMSERVISSGDNPVSRKVALEGAATITKNGWRAWVEHATTKKSCFKTQLKSNIKSRLSLNDSTTLSES